MEGSPARWDAFPRTRDPTTAGRVNVWSPRRPDAAYGEAEVSDEVGGEPPARVETATTADRAALSATLADAFDGDPVWDWLVPAEEHRARLRRLFGCLLAYALPRGHVYTTGDRGAVAMWSPPGQWKVPPAALLRSAVPMARAAGMRLPRLLRRLGDIERVHAGVSSRHWYLEFIGASAARQGSGYGSRLLADALRRCDADGLPVYLESSNPRNLPFYQRHGFTVTDELTFRAGPPQWTLWRDPAAAE